MPPPPPRRPPPKSSSSRPGGGGGGGAGAASKEENIYIPSFISKRPFYAGEDGDDTTDYLEHQRLQKQKDESTWYDRGRKAGPAATKYRKGACENCGAMTHKAKDCLSRPRAKKAKFTGRDIQADEVVQDVRLGWDAKRDRWNGYEAGDYDAVVDEYNRMEELKREMVARRAREKGGGGDDDDKDAADDDADADADAGDKYAEESDMSKHQPTSTRQLRIREDTAKYLLNLDLDSAKYDPKSRSMVDAGATVDKAAALFAEEGFLRESGDAAEFSKAQRYAWEAQERSGDTGQHLQANPTAGEFYRKKEKEEAEQKRAARQKMLLDKYGGEQHRMPEAVRDMAVTESEQFVEYDEYGLVKGAPRTMAKSKYAEDVFVNNHTSVWGSWWSDFRWGYACCHSFIKNSYCTGEAGKRAWEESERQRTGVGLEEREEGPPEEPDEAMEGLDDTSNQAKKRSAQDMMGGVSEQELEEYRKKRMAADDPMAKMLGNDELVH